jgi:hypothetical protein
MQCKKKLEKLHNFYYYYPAVRVYTIEVWSRTL